MMNKVVLCINVNACGNYLLPLLNHPDIIVHSDPRVLVVDGKTIRNFDYLVDCTIDGASSDWASFAEALGDRYIDVKRVSKITQSLVLKRLGIPTPTFGFIPLQTTNAVSVHTICALADAMGFSTGDSIMLKTINGARGMGQCVVKYDDLYRLANKHIGSDKEHLDFKDTWYELGGAEEDQGQPITTTFLEYDTPYFLMSEFVDIVSEYRVLFNNAGVRLLSERTVKDKGSYQASAGTEPADYTVVLPTEIRKWIEVLIENIKLPFGSIDVYVDSDGKYGVLEYCTEFGYSDTPSILEIRNMTSDGLVSLIVNREKQLKEN